ncbi:MAG: HAMP domain-containing histidine kinase [Nitrospirae bacterium]|nr:HAMP domain-containing histidine kinase [Nitrospirota bacterium]
MPEVRMPTEDTPYGFDEKLAFIGKVLSVFTHEMKNHLAIINETAGLLGDLVEFGGRGGGEFDKNQILKTVRDVELQVKESSSMVTMLNRFGHRMDHPVSIFNVNDTIEELTALINRMISQRRLSFELNLPGGVSMVEGNPSTLQLLLFRIISDIMAGLAEKSKIALITRQDDDTVTIVCKPVGEKAKSQPVSALTQPASQVSANHDPADLNQRYKRSSDELGALVTKSSDGVISVVLPISNTKIGPLAGDITSPGASPVDKPVE